MSSPSGPAVISDDLVELFASGVDVYVATRDAELTPESAFAIGVLVHQDRRSVTVYVAAALAAKTLANLDDNGQVAVTLAHAPDHRTVQLKGRAVGYRESTESDRQIQEICRAALTASMAEIGVPRALTRALPWWPSIAVTFEVADIYTQTPGPRAGERLSS